MDGLAGTSRFGGVYGAGIARPQRGSSIVIGYESALAFWRRSRVEDPALTRELLGQLYPDDMLATLDAEALAADTSLRPLEFQTRPSSAYIMPRWRLASGNPLTLWSARTPQGVALLPRIVTCGAVPFPTDFLWALSRAFISAHRN